MNPNAPVFVPRQPLIGDRAVGSDAVAAAKAVVSTEASLNQLLRHLAGERLLCVDCEGADLSKGSWRNGQQLEAGPDMVLPPLHGRLCLLQLSTMAGESFAVDILELGDQAFETGLRAILESEEVVKVVHDFRQDADALWHQFRIHARGLFDCQLCDVLVRRLRGLRTTYVQGSAKLLTTYGIDLGSVTGYGLLTQEQKQLIHARFSEDRHLWQRRPLPIDMVEYALQDVQMLPELYSRLLAILASLVQGGEAAALRLVQAGSAIYAASFAELPSCRCRLCCNAAENARFDGHRLLTGLSGLQCFDGELMRRLWRPEDAHPISAPAPSRFYVNDQDESVPIPC